MMGVLAEANGHVKELICMPVTFVLYGTNPAASNTIQHNSAIQQNTRTGHSLDEP